MLFILFIIFIIGLFLDFKSIIEHYNNNQTYIPKLLNDPLKLLKYKKENPTTDIQSNLVYTANLSEIKKQHSLRSIYRFQNTQKPPETINSIIKSKVPIGQIKPVENFTTSSSNRYKLYGEDNLDFKPAGIISDPANIDQTVNINIMNHTNKGTNKTIKDLYDEITEDNRSKLQTNIEDLNAYDPNDNFNIDKKYGHSSFDTYSMR